MPDERGPSLLDLATTASLAIVPVLLGVLLVSSALRTPEAAPGRDRYLNVRQLAALKTLEHAIVPRQAMQAPLPDAAAVLSLVPACRRDWSAAPGVLARLRQLWPGERVPVAAERISTQLAQLDGELARFSGSGNRRVAEALGVDAGRWAAAAQHAMRTPAESADYPGRRFDLRCSDLAFALESVTRGGSRLLESLAWRGTTVPQVVARWRPEQFVEFSARQVERENPWRGLPGCVYLAGSGTSPLVLVGAGRTDVHRLCALPAVAGSSGQRAPAVTAVGETAPATPLADPRWMVPPSLQTLLRPLQPLQRPTGALYRAYTELPVAGSAAAYRYGPNRVELDGHSVELGFTIDLTIDPAAQALAQKTAACYTGRQDACRALGIRRREDGDGVIGHRLLEQAVVRMAAVAIIDVATGRIEAIAGALSPCARQAYDGPGLAPGCDLRLPYGVGYRPDALLNPAVFHDAMPASVIKPIMAAAFLSEQGARQPGGLAGELARSDSPRFLNRMFCAEQGFAGCERPQRIQETAVHVGWNAACASEPQRCGKRDLLFGRSPDATAEAGRIQPLAHFVPYGRLLVEPAGAGTGAPFAPMALSPFEKDALRRCALGADGALSTKDDWKKCRGAALVDVVAEGWGQGHARTTALGAAGMMATLAAAANGQQQQAAPHLVSAVRGVGLSENSQLRSAVQRWSLAQPVRVALQPRAAAVILEALTHSHRGGSAQAACEQVFDARRCRKIDWLAGKTGTPSFPNDGRSLGEIARLCAPSAGEARQQGACSRLRPYKWYVAAYRTDTKGAGWTKAIAVLTERNWLAHSGRVQGAGDVGPNPAAEIAMQVIARQTGLLGPSP